MTMKIRSLCLALLAAPVLAGCIHDGATYEIDNTREHVLSLIRQQPYFWDKSVDLFLVVSRMPACMRRHSIGPGTAATRVEVYQVPSGAFIIKAGKRMYATETQTCESFARMTDEPVEGMGQLIGTFRERKGELMFVRATPEEKDGEETGAR
jgi:hypothetical protein